MKHIKPAIQPQTNALVAFADFLGEYTHKTWDDFVSEAKDERKDAEEALQDDLREQLRTEIESASLITCDCPLDCRPNTDNLMEWLYQNYRLEEK